MELGQYFARQRTAFTLPHSLRLHIFIRAGALCGRSLLLLSALLLHAPSASGVDGQANGRPRRRRRKQSQSHNPGTPLYPLSSPSPSLIRPSLQDLRSPPAIVSSALMAPSPVQLTPLPAHILPNASSSTRLHCRAHGRVRYCILLWYRRQAVAAGIRGREACQCVTRRGVSPAKSAGNTLFITEQPSPFRCGMSLVCNACLTLASEGHRWEHVVPADITTTRGGRVIAPPRHRESHL